MDRPEDPSSSASEKMPEGDKMDVCGSTEEMDVCGSTEENNEGGNQAGGPTGEPPSQVNQAKNRSAAMATDTQPGGGKKPKPSSEDLQAEETGRCSMKCPKCGFKFVPSVKFVKEKNEQGKFSIDLHKESKDAPFFTDKLACPKQAPDTKMNCPNCEYNFLYKRVATSVNNKRGGFDINLSIKIPKEVQQKGRTGDDQPATQGTSGASGRQSVNEVQEEQGMEQDHPKPSAEPTGSNTDESSPGVFQVLWNKVSENPFKRKTSERSNPTIWSLAPPTVKVCCINTAETFGADVALMKAVKNSKGKSPEVEETSVNECSLIIIFCPVMHRTSDVKSAMEDTRVSSSGKPVILVLMHHTIDVDYSTAGFNRCEELKNVVLLVHVFYHDSVNGLLECRQNTGSIETIQKELLKYKQ